jgi:hypothetical protein
MNWTRAEPLEAAILVLFFVGLWVVYFLDCFPTSERTAEMLRILRRTRGWFRRRRHTVPLPSNLSERWLEAYRRQHRDHVVFHGVTWNWEYLIAQDKARR